MAKQEQKNAPDLGGQAVKLAEELGRIAGTIEGTAESLLGGQQLTEQLTQLRDRATQMLEGLAAAAERGRTAVTTAARPPARRAKKKTTAAPAASSRRPDPSRAAGKRRRRPAPNTKGLKKSDERIPKLRTATAVRQRRKSYT